MSYVRILVHAVFSTKRREALLSNEHKNLICEHIRETCAKKSIRLLEVNGYVDHLHCLISLKPGDCIAHIMQSIKGESAYWFNHDGPSEGGFRLTWQDDYYAVSVSEVHLERVRLYIQRQEAHHQAMTHYQEMERMASKYGLDLPLDKEQLTEPSAKADGNG